MSSSSSSSSSSDGGSLSVNVAVLGDASGSMQIAIKCACSLGALLSVCLHADLVFFADTYFVPPVVPRTAAQVLQVAETVKASGATSPAAALYHYYSNRIKIDVFVLVSDEGENTPFEGYTFLPLFRRYRLEIHSDAKLLLVSFLGVTDTGLLKQQADDWNSKLATTSSAAISTSSSSSDQEFSSSSSSSSTSVNSSSSEWLNVRQFRFDKERPDTSKFDGIVGLVTLETQSFQERWLLLDDVMCGAVGYGLAFPTDVRDVILQY